MQDVVQPWLPKVSRATLVKRNRKSPEPRDVLARPIKKYEILHRPCDLKFRGEVNHWLARNNELGNMNYAKNDLLTEFQINIIRHYFFPQKGKWLTQNQVKRKLKLKNTGNFRKIVVESLLVIWEEKNACN